MESEILLIFVILIALLIIFTYPLVLYVIKYTAPYRKNFFWIYRGKIYTLDVDLTKSQYYGKGCTSIDKYRWMQDYPTVDDTAVIEIAQTLDKLCIGKSDTFKAGMILAFVQQNVRYTSDLKQYGKSEYWTIPIQPLTSRMGDCEDTAILYCSIAYNMGLKCRLITVTGHATAGVANVVGLAGFVINNQKYIIAETTDHVPILGWYVGKTDLQKSAEPQMPSQAFLDTLQYTG